MFSGSFNVMKSPFHDIIMEIPAQSAPPALISKTQKESRLERILQLQPAFLI
jgi:hypothetical protein